MVSLSPMQTHYAPAEWSWQKCCWLAFPSRADLWQQHLREAQQESLRFCQIVGQSQRVGLLVDDAALIPQIKFSLRGAKVRVVHMRYGDIWLRDTGPIFVQNTHKQQFAACFSFNGWGNKYLFEEDQGLSARLATVAKCESQPFSLTLEGGSIDLDGEGTCLTTRQCLLNPNRNPELAQEQIEAVLQTALGVRKVLWLHEGLMNDHTDGHIDNLARFVKPGVVVCMEPTGDNDPNQVVLQDIAQTLANMTDACGRRLHVVSMPSPGAVLDEAGQVMPASYTNFYIGNYVVVVPQYGVPQDAQALSILRPLFLDRQVIGLPARAILSGGGAFHCMTQQQPLVVA